MENRNYLIANDKSDVSDQEYQGSDGAVEGGDSEGDSTYVACSVGLKNVHTIEEMKAWQLLFGYSDAIKDATIYAILCEFVMSKVSCDEMSIIKTIFAG